MAWLTEILYIHVLSAIAWASSTTGAYWLVRWAGLERSPGAAAAYYRLSLIQIVSGAMVFATGLHMATSIGFPRWALAAALLAAPVGVMDAVHALLARRAALRGDLLFLKRFGRLFELLYTALFLAILYLMIFKPPSF